MAEHPVVRDQPETLITTTGAVISATTFNLNGFTWFQAFFGVSILSTPNGTLDFYIGLSAGGSGSLLQAEMIHQPPDPSNEWSFQEEIFGPSSSPFSPLVASNLKPAPIQPAGVWGVIRYYGCSKEWKVGFYKGTPTSGPRMAQLISNGASYPDPGGTFFGKLTFASCVLEIRPAAPDYTCQDIAATGVFGGLRLYHGVRLMPVNWVRGAGAPIPCSQTAIIANGRTNPNAQVTIIGSTV